jgi:hypothetical protein
MRWLVRLYPRAWQARYGGEFAALLGDLRPTPRVFLDACLGALDAHLNPSLLRGGFFKMVTKLCKAEFTILWAFAGFIVAGMYLNGMLDDTPLPAANATHAALGFPWHVLQAGALVAALATFVGGVPIVLAVARKALAEKRRDVLVRLALPLVVALVTGVYVLVLGLVFAGGTLPQSTIRLLFQGGLSFCFIGGGILSTWGVTSAVRLSEIEAGPLRFATLPATIVAASMGVMLIASLIWGINGMRLFPEMFAANYGFLAINTRVWWIAMTVLMLVTTAAALEGTRRALRANAEAGRKVSA